MAFLPDFTINNTKLDAGSIEVTIGGQRINGITAINYTVNHDSGDVTGVGGRITGYTPGIFRGGQGSITFYYEDFTAFFNANAVDTVQFFRQTYDMTITYRELLAATNALTIVNIKPTNISQTYTLDSSDALLVDVSFKFTNLQDKGLLGNIGRQVVDAISSFI